MAASPERIQKKERKQIDTPSLALTETDVTGQFFFFFFFQNLDSEGQ